MDRTLAEILEAAAYGHFPPPDGGTTVVSQPSRRDAGVIAFTGHSVVFTDEDPQWVRRTLATLDCDSLAATMNPRFLGALLDRTRRCMDTIDLLTVASCLAGPPPLPLTELADAGHPREVRSRRRRDDIRVWAAEGGGSCSAAAWPVVGRRRWRSTTSVATGAWGGRWPRPPDIWCPTASRSGPSRPPATRAACAPFRRRAFDRWAPKRFFSRRRYRFGPSAPATVGQTVIGRRVSEITTGGIPRMKSAARYP